MSDIKLERTHHPPLKDARTIAHKAHDDPGQEYELVSAWEGDTPRFHRSGVDGHVHVATSHIDLNVKVGFLPRPFRSTFEHHIERNLDTLLAGSPETMAKAGTPAKKAATRKA